jgi:hypothetical protein
MLYVKEVETNDILNIAVQKIIVEYCFFSSTHLPVSAASKMMSNYSSAIQEYIVKIR